MELTQTRTIGAPAGTVWAALNDPAVLKACIPGCESLERVSDSEWKSVVATRIGPVQARFTGRLLLEDVAPPQSYTLKFEGQGGAAGFANGQARVSLEAMDPDTTALTYVASARVGGKIAQLGSRLVDGAAAKLADDFFMRFAAQVASSPPAPDAGSPTAAAGRSGELSSASSTVAGDRPDSAAAPAAPARASASRGASAAAERPGRAWVRYAALAGIVVVLAVLYLYRQR